MEKVYFVELKIKVCEREDSWTGPKVCYTTELFAGELLAGFANKENALDYVNEFNVSDYDGRFRKMLEKRSHAFDENLPHAIKDCVPGKEDDFTFSRIVQIDTDWVPDWLPDTQPPCKMQEKVFFSFAIREIPFYDI